MKKNYYLLFICITMSILLMLFGCSTKNVNMKESKKEITIAYQPSVGYAPLLVMKENKILEKECNNELKVNWVEMKSGAAITEGIISGNIDIGTMGVPVAINGILAGSPFKIAFGVSAQPYSILTNDDKINSLSDINESNQIGIVNINSMPHILLGKACKALLGDAHALDSRLVVLSNTDGYTALLSKAISCHIVISPFNFMELKNDNIKEIKISDEIWPPKNSSIVGVVSNNIKNEYPDLYSKILIAVEKSMSFIKENPDECAKILSTSYDASVNDIKEWITDYRSSYSSEIYGIMDTALFMNQEGFSDKMPNKLEDLVYDNVKGN